MHNKAIFKECDISPIMLPMNLDDLLPKKQINRIISATINRQTKVSLCKCYQNKKKESLIFTYIKYTFLLIIPSCILYY
jgi:hypothetical protein